MENNTSTNHENGNDDKRLLAARDICEVVYNLNVAMLFSGVFDNIKGGEIRELMQGVLKKHGVWDEYVELVNSRL